MCVQLMEHFLEINTQAVGKCQKLFLEKKLSDLQEKLYTRDKRLSTANDPTAMPSRAPQQRITYLVSQPVEH